MLNTSATVTIDLHNKNTYQAKVTIESALRRSKGVYRIRVIHGFHNGTVLRDMIATDYAHDPRILKMERVNEGTTELVLKNRY